MSFHMSIRRKVAIATWNSPKEGNIYGKLTIDMTNALKYIEYLRDLTQKKITITHLIGKSVGMALAECPDINGRILFGRYIPHKTADVSFLVSLENGKDLDRLKITSIDQKSISQIADELKGRAQDLKSGKDRDHEKSKPILKMLPTWLIKPILRFFGFLSGAVGLDLPAFGVKKFPFGACLITNVGMFGIDEGYAPPVPFAHIPVLLSVPEIKKRPIVENDQIVIKPMLDIMATIDHRFLDGHRGSMIAKMLKNMLENPWIMDGFSQMPS